MKEFSITFTATVVQILTTAHPAHAAQQAYDAKGILVCSIPLFCALIIAIIPDEGLAKKRADIKDKNSGTVVEIDCNFSLDHNIKNGKESKSN
jgi:hypothetical protein